MKNKRLEERRKKISKDIDIFVNQSFDIVDRIHEILTKQGKDQKYLAVALDKSESEISKWMTGTHNFTIKTLAKIEEILGEPVIQTTKEKPLTIPVNNNIYVFHSREKTSSIPVEVPFKNYQPVTQLKGNCLN